jgi:hypothetical protein
LIGFIARRAEHDAAAIERDQIKLQGQTFAVVVIPRRADACPEGRPVFAGAFSR